MGAIPISRRDADVRGRLLVQGPVRHKDMRTPPQGRCAYDIDFRRATTSSLSNCATRARSSSPRRCAPNITAAPATPAAATSPKRCCPRRSATSAAAGAATAPNVYDTTRAPLIGVELGPRGVSVSANLVMASLGEEPAPQPAARPTTTPVALILPAQGGLRFLAAVIGGAVSAPHLYLRPSRHPLPHDRRLRQGARRAEGPGERLLRPARPLDNGAARSAVLGGSPMRARTGVGRAGCPQGHAHQASSANRCWCRPGEQATVPICSGRGGPRSGGAGATARC